MIEPIGGNDREHDIAGPQGKQAMVEHCPYECSVLQRDRLRVLFGSDPYRRHRALAWMREKLIRLEARLTKGVT